MKFRFGNGQARFAESSITLQNWVGGQPYPMKVHTLDVENVPLLVSIKNLKDLGAIIDFSD
eukprot:11003032-Alexandrium_andersonii.AAC.1